MTLVFLLEDRSMKAFLEGLLPRILPRGVVFHLIPHEGKSDLRASIPRKLRAWRTPDTRFVIVHDQDSADCVRLKGDLTAVCADAGRPDALVRIACRELEAWFLGDLAGVERALGAQGLAHRQASRKFRDPDALGSPSRELASLVGSYGKVSGARAIGPELAVEACCSRSFQVFVAGVRRLADAAVPGADGAI